MAAVQLATHLGPVDALDFGCAGAPLVLCIQGKSANLDVITEWEPAARELAAVGLRVLLPNLHSNAATKPGFMASVDTEKLLLGIYEHAGATSAVIMGKSWGGGEAVAFAAAHPVMVRLLVLVAPSLTDTSLIARIARLPAVLYWARDDPVRSFGLSQLYVDGMADVVLHAVPQGGHRVLDEYLPTLCTAASDALWAPPKRLHRATHVGRFVRVEPLEADRHCDELFAAFQVDQNHSRWAYSFQSGFSSREALWAYLASVEAGTGAYFGVYVDLASDGPLIASDCTSSYLSAPVLRYVDLASGTAAGLGALMSVAPERGTAEIAEIMLSPRIAGAAAGTEAMILQIRQAFALGYRRVEWSCDPHNEPAMRAAQRLGFTYEVTFRQRFVIRGRTSDQAVFAITRPEWPAIERCYCAWLDPSNFGIVAGGIGESCGEGEGEGEGVSSAPVTAPYEVAAPVTAPYEVATLFNRQKTSLSSMTAPLLSATPPRTNWQPPAWQVHDPAAVSIPIGLPAVSIPIGPPLDSGWKPPPSPVRLTLRGARVACVPLALEHASALHAAYAGAGDVHWTFLSYGPFDSQAALGAWLSPQTTSADPFFFALEVNGVALGLAAFLRIAAAHGCLEIGHLSFGPQLARTPPATEALFLMLQWTFRNGYRRIEWKCNARHVRSRAAALRLGFVFEGVTRQATVVRQRNRDTAWFSILDAEWPRVGAALSAWLSPANFDSEGRQRRRLEEIRAGMEPDGGALLRT